MTVFTPSKADRSGRVAILILEWVAGLIGLLFILVGLLFARLAAGPLEITLLTPYIESALSDGVRGLTASVGQSQLIWDRDGRQLELRLDETLLTNLEGGQVVAVPQAVVRLSALKLLLGQIDVHEIRVNGANIALERSADGQLGFLGVAPPPQPSPVPPPPLSAVLTSIPEQLAALNKGLSQLHTLTVSAVQVSLLDRTKTDEAATPQTITLPDLELRRDSQGRLIGGAQIKLDLTPDVLVFNLSVNMLPGDGVGEVKLGWDKLNFATLGGLAPELAGLSGIEVPLTGALTLNYGGNRKQSPMLVTLEVDAGQGSILLPGLMPDKTAVKSAHALLAAKATVGGGIDTASLRDVLIDLDGLQISGSVELAPEVTSSLKSPAIVNLDLAKGERRLLKVDVGLKNVEVHKLSSLWPPQLASGARDWVTQHLRDGVAPEATLKMSALLDWPQLKEMSIAELGGTMAMNGVTVDYLPELPPITGSNATATFDINEMKIDITAGVMNNVQLQPSTAIIDLASTPESIAIEARGAGPLPRILEAIDKQPLGYASKVGLKPADLNGDVDFTLKLAFPLLSDLEMDAIQLGMEGTVRNFASDKLVNGLKLTNGTLIVGLDTSTMNLSGPITINGAAASLTWKEVFDPGSGPGSSAIVTTQADNALLENLGAGKVDYIVGSIPLTVKYERFNQGGDTVELNADLKAGGLKLTPIGYEKAVGDAGKLNAKVKLPASNSKNQAIQISSLTASGSGMNVQGTGTLLQKPLRIQKLNISKGQFAGSTFTANLSRLGETGWQGTVNASELNIGALLDPNDKSPPERLPPLDLTINAQRAIFAPDRVISPLKVLAKYNGAAWQQLEMDLTAKETPFSFKLVPMLAGGQSLKIETPNLGSVLYATDLTDTIVGGRLNVEGKSKSINDKVEARIDLRDFRIRNMPFIASLISAISAEGLLNALSRDEGLSFNRLRGDIDWQGDHIFLKNVKTSGGALGLTIEGDVNTFEETVALQGTAVPFNSVNSLLGNVPIVGQILGGSSGVFAATYSARGPFDDIRVGVNPLSILAPGFLRDLFFIEG